MKQTYKIVSMRKVGIFLILYLCAILSVNAKIEYNVNKYGVMFVNFVVDDENPTIDLFQYLVNNTFNRLKINELH